PYFAGGFSPVATRSSPMPFEKKLANLALHARLQKEMPKTVPIEANEANCLTGARAYLTNCAVPWGSGKSENCDRPRRVPQPAGVTPWDGRHRRSACRN